MSFRPGGDGALWESTATRRRPSGCDPRPRTDRSQRRRSPRVTARCALVAALVLFVPIAVTVTAATARAATPSAGAPALTIGADGLPESAPSPGGAASGDTPTGAGAADSTATSTVPTSPGSTGTAPTSTAPTNTAPTGTPTSKPCIGPSPSGIYGATLTFTISTITPQLVTAGGPAALTVTGTMRNRGEHALSELGYKYQRGDALVGEAAIRNEVAQPCQPITVVDSGFVTVDGDLAAGASTTFQATVPIAGDPTRTLAVTDPGVYPIMINFNATVGLSSGDLRARVGEVHLLLTVLSVPPAPALPTGPALDEGSATPDATTGSTAATAGGAATAPTPPPGQPPRAALRDGLDDRGSASSRGRRHLPGRRSGAGDLAGWPAVPPGFDDDVHPAGRRSQHPRRRSGVVGRTRPDEPGLLGRGTAGHDSTPAHPGHQR